MTANDCDNPETPQRDGYFKWNVDDFDSVAEYFHQHGWAVVQGHVPTQECEALRQAGCKIMDEFYTTIDAENGPTFSTEAHAEHQSKDKRFLTSASGVTCFLEADDRRVVNKIGHALHDLLEPFRRFSHDPNHIHFVARGLLGGGEGGEDKKEIVQSMYIVKGANTGGPVRPHRDATFVRAVSGKADDCVGFWWPLEKADVSNGCLWVVPRSHRDEHRVNQFIRQKDDRLVFDRQESDCDMYEQADYVSVPVNIGDLVLLHGGVVHQSFHNRSSKSRHAYSIHVVKGSVASDCWIRRSDDLPFQQFC